MPTIHLKSALLRRLSADGHFRKARLSGELVLKYGPGDTGAFLAAG